jgi:acyl carrier protein
MSDVAVRVRKLVIKHLRIDEEKVTDDANFVGDLGADSLNAVELVLAFENEFECKIPDDQVGQLSTVKGVISFIESTQPPGEDVQSQRASLAAAAVSGAAAAR